MFQIFSGSQIPVTGVFELQISSIQEQLPNLLNPWAQYGRRIGVADFSRDTKKYSATSLLLGNNVRHLQSTGPTKPHDFVGYETSCTCKSFMVQTLLKSVDFLILSKFKA